MSAKIEEALINDLREEVRELKQTVEYLDKLLRDTLSWKRSSRDKPHWWNDIIVNIGDISWEQAGLLEEGIRLIIKHKLTDKMNVMWSYEQGRDNVDTLKLITDLLGRVEVTKKYAYDQYQDDEKKKVKKK